MKSRSGLLLALAASICFGQTGDKGTNDTSTDSRFEKVSLCQVAENPGAFNRKPVEVDAFVSHGFEDSSIFEAGCGKRYAGIWMEYGGTASTATMYCCGSTPNSTRPEVLIVEGVKLPLVENENFETLNTLLHKDDGRTVRATLRGTFFAGKQDPWGNGKTTLWGGYGHMGCCSLFVIQEVASVLPQNVGGIDYTSSLDQPDTEKEGCGSYSWHEGEEWKTLVAQQRAADRGSDTWRYDKPSRVGAEGLAKLLNQSAGPIKLKETQRKESRIIYYWRPNGRDGVRYMVVVNRPYALSLEAKDPSKTIWTVAQMYSVCT